MKFILEKEYITDHILVRSGLPVWLKSTTGIPTGQSSTYAIKGSISELLKKKHLKV
jgi:hypothetical protein